MQQPAFARLLWRTLFSTRGVHGPSAKWTVEPGRLSAFFQFASRGTSPILLHFATAVPWLK